MTLRQAQDGRGPKISDHALVRFLERGGGLDVELLREQISAVLTRAHSAARAMGTSDHLIKVDGMTFVVRGDTVATVLETGRARDEASHLAGVCRDTHGG